jgi:hypothetical protein
MAKKRAKQGGEDASGSAQTRRQRLRRDALRVRRIEIVLRANVGDDAKTSDWLDSLPSGTISDFVRSAVEEKIAREIVARNQQVADERLVSDLRAQLRDQEKQIARLHEDNAALRLNGSVPFDDEPVTVLSEDDARQSKLSGKLKKINFAGLM